LILVRQALEEILLRLVPLPPRRVDLPAALGLVLAEEVQSSEDLPPWANSAVDGYAVRAEDCRQASPESPVRLEVLEEVRAGRLPTRPLAAGQASRIMTGAPLPQGADTCVMVEDTREVAGRVEVLRAPRPGQNVRPAGEDVRRGETVLPAGTLMGPAEIAMAAALGRPELLCHRRPRVAILATGDELVEPGAPVGPGQIRNSNSYALEAQVRLLGAEPLRLGPVPDRPRAIEAALAGALEASDLVLTSAGVSVGEHDHVKTAMERLGLGLIFWRVAMRPGKPLVFGVTETGKAVLGLPGNPVSCMVTFEVFARPAILRLLGARDLDPPTLRARLAAPVAKVPELRFFLRCRLRPAEDGWLAETTGPQGSGILKSMVQAQGLLEIPEGVARLEAGEPVTVRLLWPGLARG
jgi:molybdopterin molybdotransferase